MLYPSIQNVWVFKIYYQIFKKFRMMKKKIEFSLLKVFLEIIQYFGNFWVLFKEIAQKKLLF